jgi:phosphopantetheine--protein transferase-like protein
MKIGTDIVFLPEFSKKLKTETLLNKLFTSSEMSIHKSDESLAGVFAAKEAVMKACGKTLNWHEIEVLKKENGQPYITSIHATNVDVSISHSGEYAIAFVIIY